METFFAENVPYWTDLPGVVTTPILGLIPAILIVLIVITPVGLVGIWAERRIAGWMQDRQGPNRVGIPFLHDKYKWARLWGLGQSVADGIKLLGKEDFVPPGGSKWLFLAAPLIVFAGSLAIFAALPLSDGLQAIDPKIGVFYTLGIGAVEVLGVLMAGWASNNKWSLLGAMREVAQVVSYEIPLSISALCPVLVAGSLQWSEIVAYQMAPPNFWGLELPFSGEWFLGWMIFHAFPFNVIAFVIFYICALAEMKRAPFDLPEAESELVAGFLTEYSGMRWSLFFLGEYAAMFAISGVAATLFLGGWGGPIHALLSGGETGTLMSTIGGVIEFSYKSLALFLFMMLIRWTLPRIRMDQVMSLCYKYLIPISLVCLFFAGLAAVAEGPR